MIKCICALSALLEFYGTISYRQLAKHERLNSEYNKEEINEAVTQLKADGSIIADKYGITLRFGAVLPGRHWLYVNG